MRVPLSPELAELMDELDGLPEFRQFPRPFPDFRKGFPSDFNGGFVFKVSNPHLLTLRAGSEGICKRAQTLLTSVGIESNIEQPGFEIWQLIFEIPEGGEHIILAKLRGHV